MNWFIAADQAVSARSRHPSVRSWPGAEGLRHRVADSLELEGVPWPEVAADLLAARGRSGLGVEAFARRAGVEPAVLIRAEAGHLARAQLPGPLRQMVAR